MLQSLLLRDLNLAGLDVVGDVLGAAAVNLAASGESSSEDLLDGTLGVLDVLLLLAVTRGLLKGLDDEGGSGWDDRDGGLTVLDGQLDSDTETLPVTSGLGDIFTDLCDAC
jgi:hypothetical protein